MCQTCEIQILFWKHILQTDTIDFNSLNKDGERVLKHSTRTNTYWKQINRINSTYCKIIGKYFSYLKNIRNNEQESNMIKDRYKELTHKKDLSPIESDNDVLFSERTAVIHVSGSKEGTGKVLHASQNTLNVLGYAENELKNSAISKIMPWIIGKNHNRLMKNYFESGRSRVINKEQYLYAQHKSGFCFRIKLLVREMPDLSNDFIQYVGLITRVVDDCEYVLTDAKGVICTMTEKLARALEIKREWLHQSIPINIQLFAPDLVSAYSSDTNTSKYKEDDGEEIVLVIPQGLVESLSTARDSMNKSFVSGSSFTSGTLAIYNSMLNSRKSFALKADDMWQLNEYKNKEVCCKVKCQIKDMTFNVMDGMFPLPIIDEDSVKLRVLKIIGLKYKKGANEGQEKSSKENFEDEGTINKKDRACSEVNEKLQLRESTKEFSKDIIDKMFNMSWKNNNKVALQKPQIKSTNEKAKDNSKRKLNAYANSFNEKHIKKKSKKMIRSVTSETVADNFVESNAINNSSKKLPEISEEVYVSSENSINEEKNLNDFTIYKGGINESMQRFNNTKRSYNNLETESIDLISSEGGLMKQKSMEDDLIDFPCKFTENESQESDELKYHFASEFDEESIAFVYPKRSSKLIKTAKGVTGSLEKRRPSLEISKSFKLKEKESNEQLSGSRVTLNEKKLDQITQNPSFMAKEEHKKIDILSIVRAKSELQLETPRHINEKRLKLCDNPEFDIPNGVYPKSYEPTEHEVALRQYFYIRQANDKKTKDQDESKDEANLHDDEMLNDPSISLSKNPESDEEGSAGSISIASVAYPLYVVRSAVEERFIPRSLKFVNIGTGIIALFVIALGVFNYLQDYKMCEKMKFRLKIIELSEQRITYLNHINMHLHNVLEQAYAYPTLYVPTNEMTQSAMVMLNASMYLTELQTNVSKAVSELSSEESGLINLDSVCLKFNNFTNKTLNHTDYTLSQSLIVMALCILRAYSYVSMLKSGYIAYLKNTEEFIYQFLENSFNSVQIALYESNNQIIKQIFVNTERELNGYLIIMLVVIGIIAVTIIALSPVVVWIKKKRDEVLILFVKLPKDEIKKYQQKCERFKKLNEIVPYHIHIADIRRNAKSQ